MHSVKRVIKSANLATAEVEEVKRAQDTLSLRIQQLKVKQRYSSKLYYYWKLKIICEFHTQIPY